MTNEELYLAIVKRMDSMESKIDSMESRMDRMESRMDNVESRIDRMEDNIMMEIQAVRTEMEVVNKQLNAKIDKLMFYKDVDGIEKMKIRIDVLEQGYQTLREKIV